MFWRKNPSVMRRSNVFAENGDFIGFAFQGSDFFDFILKTRFEYALFGDRLTAELG